MNKVNEPKSLGIRDLILASTSMAVIFGFAEWLVIGGMGFSLRQEEACRIIFAIIILYGLFGTIIGLISAITPPMRNKPIISVSLPLALLIFFLFASKTPHSSLFIPAAFGVGVCYLIIFRWVASRFTFLSQPRLWWISQGIILIIALALATLKAPNTINLWIAVSIVFISVILLIWEIKHGPHHLWRSITVTVVIFLVCGFLGFRIPTVHPEVTPNINQASVLLITVDTLRADHVGAYGYTQARTPHLDDLAKRGVLFREVVTPHRWTGPSHASILTGLMPENHGVFKNGERLSQSVTTIADFFSSKGYVTASFASSYTTVDAACGLPSHFQVYNDDIGRISWFPEKAYRITLLQYIKKALSELFRFDIFYPAMYRTASRTADMAIAWLERNHRHPYFIWVHFFDPHLPYKPPKEYVSEEVKNYKGPVSGRWYFLSASEQVQIVTSPENIEQMISLYDAEIAYVDHEVGRLVAAAERNASKGRLLTIVTADHGESMGEHHLYWGRDLYDPTLLVPLIIVLPDEKLKRSMVINDQVRTIDITPTILELLDLDSSEKMDGISLVGLIKDSVPFQESAKSEIYFHNEEDTLPASSIRHKGWKLIKRAPSWDRRYYIWNEDGSQELYNLKDDPSEEKNLITTSIKELKELEEELEKYRHELIRQEIELDPAMKERLRGLGYLR